MKRYLLLFLFLTPIVAAAQIPDSIMTNIKTYAANNAEGDKDLARSIIIQVSKDYLELSKIASNKEILSKAQNRYPNDYHFQLSYYKENDTANKYSNDYYTSGNTILIHKVDKFTKEETYESKFIAIENNGKSISYYLEFRPKGKEINLGIAPKTSGCIDDNAQVNFLLNDGSAFVMGASNAFDCTDPIALLSQKIRRKNFDFKKQFEKAIDVGINAIRIGMFSSTYEYEFTQEQSFDLQELLRQAFAVIEQ